ncbi:hypothetical protein KL933_002616 [Ogataea haglerorum]|uniref:Cell wall mannoprotein PIR1-like C-terminal domain-containing protein n=1 Tax=Ogataea haglerorum TaxID=1937702 RepID=A0AAN6I0K6_9ASCO|nr:hypothetical protein KL915_002860 [Ogataea haglerorum]KAG7705777.1 hypothetical protein KL914_003615 [Ogataea haglerorum]KAG7707205.1 hypothetical protein KL950_002865 [Ogataea haglerorum]KAG7718501.1 hypothetical protein KL913_002496 [Ogataea haglerorum]KAG7718650.1 hypothetical protein KL949_002646 [Ogataea haglerorum]
MKITSSLAAISLASNAFAAYVGSTFWTTMTPSQTLDGAMTSYSATFGIAVEPLETSSSVTSSLNVEKRHVASQIDDGQIQATTGTEEETSKSTAAAVVTQITDGQIQATTATTTSSSSSSKSTAAEVVTQIGDGQIQATTSTSSKSTAADVVTQIGDGQIQATSKSSTSTAADVVSQITDGQIQATTSTEASSTTSGVISQISDGQIQASSTTASTTSSAASSTATGDYIDSVSCKKEGALAMTLKDGVLYDSEGRIGSIVANRQFQFDGPPPQAGAIYADGWSISPEGYLAIGNNTIFYQCLSGTFYNLYDESIGGQCNEVHLKAVELVDC